MDEEILIIEDETEIIEEIEIDENINYSVVNGGIKHSALPDKNDPEQHKISAITGLREELDSIEALQTVYSDKTGQADYFMWADGNPNGENREGLFVTLYQNLDGKNVIKICSDVNTEDVFGVTVSSAAFVGGQAYDGANNGKGEDNKYALVVCSGLVAVRRQTDVVAGDYVVPAANGYAKKIVENGKYGYLVSTLRENEMLYANISLSAPSTFAKHLSDISSSLKTRVDSHDTRLASVQTTASDGHSRIENIEGALEKLNLVKKNASGIIEPNTLNENQDISGIITNMGEIKGDVENVKDTINNMQTTITEAKTIIDATTANVVKNRDEAIEMHKDAVTKIEQITDGIKTLDARVEPYCVGKYSQAYGLSYGQAKLALKENIIYIPTITHDEMYDDYKSVNELSDGTFSDIQTFNKGYSYLWNGEKWDVSKSFVVIFDKSYPGDSTTDSLTRYWVVDSEEDVIHNNKTYDAGGLYYWENNIDGWDKKWDVEDEAFSRSVNYFHKTLNETAIEITNARGDFAGLGARLDSEGAKTSMVASVVTELKGVKPTGIYKTVEDLPESGDSDAYYCVGENLPYNVYIWDNEWVPQITLYYDGVNFCKINAASIVAAVNNDGDTSLTFDANKINFSGDDYTVLAKNINFSGYSAFINTDNNGNITTIDGGIIKTKSITADQIVTTGLSADYIKVEDEDGQIIFEADPKNNKVYASNLSAISGKLGTVTAGVIQSEDYFDDMWNNEDDFYDYGELEYVLSEDGEYYSVGIGNNTLDNIVIPSTYNDKPVKSILSSGFKSSNLVYGLQNLFIPSSITSIGDNGLACSTLYRIYYGGSEDDWNKISLGVDIFAKNLILGTDIIPEFHYNVKCKQNNKWIYLMPPNKEGAVVFNYLGNGENIAIPSNFEGVPTTTICRNAFLKATSYIKKLLIPSSVKRIEPFVFNGVFENSWSLTDVFIYSKNIKIDNCAFLGCKSLANIYYVGTIDDWEMLDKGDNSELEAATIYYYSRVQPTDGENKYWSVSGFRISCDDEKVINTPFFSVSRDGEITATRGQIGALTMGVDGSIFIGDNFKVSADGKMAVIDADINADTGEIGGLIIQDNSLVSDNLVLQSDTGLVIAKQLEINDYCQTNTLKLQTISGTSDGAPALYFDGESHSERTIYASVDYTVTDNGSEGFLGIGWTAGSVSIKITTKDDVGRPVALKSSKAFTVNVYYGSGTLLYDTYSEVIKAGQSFVEFTVDYRIDAFNHTLTSVSLTRNTFIEKSNSLISHIESTGSFIPKANNLNLGSSENLWNNVHAVTGYFTNIHADINYYKSGSVFTSDANKKNTIEPINEKYSTLFDTLNPVTFKLNDGTSGRTHIGLIAQDVKMSLDSLDIDSQDFAVYCSWEEDDGTEACGLRYGELISLNIYEIQKLKKRVAELEDKLNALITQQSD